MNWDIYYSKESRKFIDKNNLNIDDELNKLISKLSGNQINIDIKKLFGDWAGYHRIRKGTIRLILKINIQDKKILITKIDFRGNIYNS